MVKNPPANAGDIRHPGSIPGQEDPLEEGMATHSSILAWRIPWTEEPGGLQPIGSHDRNDLVRVHAIGRYDCSSHAVSLWSQEKLSRGEITLEL